MSDVSDLKVVSSTVAVKLLAVTRIVNNHNIRTELRFLNRTEQNSFRTEPSLLWGCTLDQPVRQASALACEGSVCHPKRERKKAIHHVLLTKH